ncbi:MAG: hypothetical protein GF353_26245 [Candidatus Lokiarchaeota archaeon]|nr:hypothetical protein [Candidatus Lokiarchaeota archaeon]
MIYELIIILISAILLILILKRYQIKKHRLTLILFFIFLNLTLAIIFSWLSKLIVLYSQINYLEDNTLPDPGTPFAWIMFRIIEFRISFVFVSIGTILSYILKVRVFDQGYKPYERNLIFSFGIFTILYAFFVFIRGFLFLDVLAFLFVSILMIIVYIPFLFRCFNAYTSVEKRTYQIAFISLAIMSLSFVLIFIMFLIDRVLILLGDPGFTVFYFAAWAFSIIGIVSAYLGYIRPRS